MLDTTCRPITNCRSTHISLANRKQRTRAKEEKTTRVSHRRCSQRRQRQTSFGRKPVAHSDLSLCCFCCFCVWFLTIESNGVIKQECHSGRPRLEQFEIREGLLGLPFEEAAEDCVDLSVVHTCNQNTTTKHRRMRNRSAEARLNGAQLWLWHPVCGGLLSSPISACAVFSGHCVVALCVSLLLCAGLAVHDSLCMP